MDFGGILRSLRLRNKMTQKELSAKLGVAEVTVSQYERGQREPNNETIIKLTKIFNVSIDYMLGVDEDVTGITYDDFTYAMFEESKNLTSEQKEILLNMAKTLNNSNNLNNSNHNN